MAHRNVDFTRNGTPVVADGPPLFWPAPSQMVFVPTAAPSDPATEFAGTLSSLPQINLPIGVIGY